MMRHSFSTLLCLTALAGCSSAPDFALPDIPIPGSFKEQPPAVTSSDMDDREAQNTGSWKEAMVLERADRGEWWKIFEDEALDALEEEALKNNPNLAAALARVEAARAMVRADASTFLPKIEAGTNVVRSQPSSAGVAAFGGNPGVTLSPYTLYSAGVTASYEVDLFGRVRGNEKALLHDAEAMDAAHKSLMLALQADVAAHYFTIRALDAELALLRRTVDVRKEAHRIMQKRFELGEAADIDTSRSQSQLMSAEADLLAVTRMRNNTEHALATLLGKMPADFSLEEKPLDAVPPEIPAGIPSDLLQRRPDIAAAVNHMQAANERIGVARTAFFPRLILTAAGGVESTTLGDLFLWSNKTWALGQLAGSALSMTLFDSGRRGARVDAAEAAYLEAVSNYKADVLMAFLDVENHLSDQRVLAEQSVKQEVAAAAATRTLKLTQLRYDEGDVSYFEVADADQQALMFERAAIQIRGQRLLTTIGLLRALGGGWNTP